MRMRHTLPITFFIFFFALIFTNTGFAKKQAPIRISVLKFGTINWTLSTIKSYGLDKKHGVEFTIQPLASSQAGKIALHADGADIIASDWTWVARQRGGASNYQFSPYSSSAGSIMVPASSSIKTINDLADKKLGIAGGALDKNWLLLRALGIRNDIQLNERVNKVFGAPPLLNNLIQQNELDALVNYWHYSARLKAKGYRELINTHDIIHQLGIERTIPILGYVFREKWGRDHSEQLNAFLAASHEAAMLLCTSDEHWAAIVPLTRATDSTTQKMLRAGYCKGRITQFTEQDRQAISTVYSILASTGGEKLVGSVKKLDPDLFWNDNND